jgi:Tfp pilus assembly protein PilF
MSDRRQEPFATVTHARLRLRQGDVREARRILSGILERDPGDSAARELLAELSAGGRSTRDDPPETAAENFRRALGIEVDARRQVIDRLENWLRRVKRNTGDAHA